MATSKDEFKWKLHCGDLRKRIEQHPKMQGSIPPESDGYEFAEILGEDTLTPTQIQWALEQYPESFVDDHEVIIRKTALAEKDRYPSIDAYYTALVELLKFADNLDNIVAEVRRQ